MKPIDSFTNEYAFLSNFYPAEVYLDGDKYATVEHAYQAAKTEDLVDRAMFRDPNLSAGGAKRIARKMLISPNWDQIKLNVMRDLLRKKFSDPRLLGMLKATGDAELIEGNWWGDYFWGVCEGKGENNLGKLLMEIRRYA